MDCIGRYQVTRELGRGAMGVVYLAVDPTIGRQVAIKTIRLSEVDDPDERAKLRERLFREARSAGILSHPGIVTIYDMEEQGDTAFIAMEYVDGPTLDQLLSSREPLLPERVMNILRQTAVALDYAHQKGIVHRDIKPANIMIAADGAVKITDFGIAKVTTSQQFTQTGTILGTPNYMSPEQVQGLAVTGRADQFSLAVIAFEMLTGERPFTGEHLTTVVYKIVAEDPTPVHRLNPTLGPEIDTVLRRGLFKKPETRYGSCVEFITGLETACAHTKGWRNFPRGGSLNLPTVVSDAATAPVMPLGSTTTEEIHRRSASKWVLPFVAALVVALGLIGLIALQFGGGLGIGHAPPQPEQSAANTTPASTPPAPAPQDNRPSPLEPAPSSASKMPEKAEPGKRETTPVSQPAEKENQPAQPAAESTSEQKPAEQPEQPSAAPPSVQKKNADLKAKPANAPQDVQILSEPMGATVVLDNNPAASCQTPCIMTVMPGRHTVTLNKDGYQHESREFHIIDSPLELQKVYMRTQAGTLMLTSQPSGAAIFVNDKLLPQSTPAQLSLAPGTYNVRVEKDGLRKSESVEVRNGVTSYLRIPLQ